MKVLPLSHCVTNYLKHWNSRDSESRDNRIPDCQDSWYLNPPNTTRITRPNDRDAEEMKACTETPN